MGNAALTAPGFRQYNEDYNKRNLRGAAPRAGGLCMVKVPDFVAYDSKIVMDYIQEFANLTEIPRPSRAETS